MRLPILITLHDSSDVAIFESLEKAEQWSEPYDLDGQTAFDAEGMVLRSEIYSKSIKLLGLSFKGPQLVRLVPTDEFQPGELRTRLVKHLEGIAVRVPHEHMQLNDLVSLAVRISSKP